MKARRGPMLRLVNVLRRYRGWMLLGALMALLGVLAGIGLLAVAGHFIAAMGLAGVAGVAFNYFTPAALIRLFAIVRTGGRYLERLLTHEATLRTLSGLRLWLFDRLLPLAPARTGFLSHADLFSRLRADVDRLEHAFLGVGVPVVVAVLAVPVVLVVQAIHVWPLAVFTAGVLLVVAIMLPWWLVHRGEAPSVAIAERETALREGVDDLVRGAPELMLYDAFERRQQEVEAIAARQHEDRRTLDRLQGWSSALVPWTAQAVAIASIGWATVAYREHALQAADIAMLALLALAVFEVVAALPEALAQLGATRLSARRVFALADQQPVVPDPLQPAPPPQGFDLVVRGLRVRHAGMSEPVLDGLDLDLPAGARVAITGVSGSGKSTLVNVLTRLLPCEAGQVSLDGRPIEVYAGDAVRAKMAVVEQRTQLFSASLRENLCIAAPDASEGAMRDALRIAQLMPFVETLGDGLDTWLGESGVQLSGGEARRVAIARAVLADRPILLLDEPTEGLDADTAAALMQALGDWSHGRSVLLISHRLGAVSRLADCALRLEGGRLQPLRVMD